MDTKTALSKPAAKLSEPGSCCGGAKPKAKPRPVENVGETAKAKNGKSDSSCCCK